MDGTFSKADHYTSICFKIFDVDNVIDPDPAPVLVDDEPANGQWQNLNLSCAPEIDGLIAENGDRTQLVNPINVDVDAVEVYIQLVIDRLLRNEPYVRYRRLDNPYGSQQRLQMRDGEPEDHGPVSLDTLYPWEVGYDGVCKAMDRVGSVITDYLKSHDFLLIAGDWGLYYNLRKYIFSESSPNEISRFVIPMPGLFHIGLNCQECILYKYSDLLSVLWKHVFPKAQTQFSIASSKLSPTRRKRFLGMIMSGTIFATMYWQWLGDIFIILVQARALLPKSPAYSGYASLIC